MGRVIEIMLLSALAKREIGDSEHALLVLTECLTLAEPEGYVRVFLDEGRPVQKLLAQWLAHADAGSLRNYAIHLLSQFDAEPRVVTAAQEKASPASDLVEPLSQRELEVLHLIALGKTNRQIAQHLILASGTVKAHTSSIYRKLEVTNRTEAVARARQLGILS
jgi:LuxR family maltose regulon positive regulatory protein